MCLMFNIAPIQLGLGSGGALVHSMQQQASTHQILKQFNGCGPGPLAL